MLEASALARAVGRSRGRTGRGSPSFLGPRLHGTDRPRQIVDNLLDNATAYAPGVIEVSVTPGAKRTLAVRDHGPGIVDEREVLTERFSRGRAALWGSGLGLAIARELAERWGGSLEVVVPARWGHADRSPVAACAGAGREHRPARYAVRARRGHRHVSDPTTRPTLVVWTDPGCPWAWETSRWLRNLRDRGLLEIEWSIFSLEVNTAGLQVPFSDAAERYGEALTAMALARREGGDPGSEAYYVALGAIVHDEGRTDLGRGGPPGRRRSGHVRARRPRGIGPDPRRGDHQEYQEARDIDVFGVPSLRLERARPIYGPIIPEAPTGAAALEWWEHISWLIGRDDVYELKRWPRGAGLGISHFLLARPPLRSDHEAHAGRRGLRPGRTRPRRAVSLGAFAVTARQLSETPESISVRRSVAVDPAAEGGAWNRQRQRRGRPAGQLVSFVVPVPRRLTIELGLSFAERWVRRQRRLVGLGVRLGRRPWGRRRPSGPVETTTRRAPAATATPTTTESFHRSREP